MDAPLDTHNAAAIRSNHQLAGSARTWIIIEAEPRRLTVRYFISGAPSGMTGTLDSSRIRSICRLTPVFRRIELSWVRKVVIWTPNSMATSLNFLPARSATASRLSAGDNPKNSAKSLSE
jgi:hypothetical protein